MHRGLRTKKSFSILELFIAVSIIAIIMFTVVPSFWRSQQRAVGSAALANLDHIRTAQILYHAEHQTFTQTAADLQSYALFTLNDNDWSYAITATAEGFVATASRNVGRPFAPFTITLTVDAGLIGMGQSQSSRIDYSAGTSYPP